MDAQLHNIELMEKWLSLDSLSNDILPIPALLTPENRIRCKLFLVKVCNE